MSRLAGCFGGAALMIALLGHADAQTVPHLSITQPGGMPGMPVLTGISKATNGVTITWDGPPGYYQLFQKPALKGGVWQAATTPYLYGRQTTLPINTKSNFFFKISGPAPLFAGSDICGECHADTYATEIQTAHAGALQTLSKIGMGNNPACLPCHTVGYKLPYGFVNAAQTPTLAGVQCENCHGAGGNHVTSESDPIVRPRVELAAEVCGGCHTDSHHPTYDEWKTSGHVGVVEDMSPAGRIDACGRCHSGSARIALLKGQTPDPNDANVGIVCAVCHEPHAVTANPAQLRNPLSSTNDYSVSTSGTLLSQYKANMNVCAQCHNHRGASWTSTSRPPHHSPQYNMLLGTVGELPVSGAHYVPGTHASLLHQCVSCHMQTSDYQSESNPANTGHSFGVELVDACLPCHPFPELLVDFTQFAISNQVQEVVAALNLWAAQKAPAALWTKYQTLAWEYTTPGTLSNGKAGPTSTEQSQIPDNIKKARFNVYIVYHDGSFGVHNPDYSVTLLDTALAWVQAELKK